MAKVPVFFSFHFDHDVFRTQMVRNIGATEKDEPVAKNEWESLRRKGDSAIAAWIDKHMSTKRCVIVLVGTHTSMRPWVRYEIKKAWNDRKALLGIHIHSLNSMGAGGSPKGQNPFVRPLYGGLQMYPYIRLYDPNPFYAYTEIAENMEQWVNAAIAAVSSRPLVNCF